MVNQRDAVRLFYSYSHKDESLRNELETHLKLLQRQGLIEPWHDRQIDASDEWKRKIDEHLERHERGDARVIPVMVRDVNWRIAPFAKLQALPKDGKAVTLWESRDSAWWNVSEGTERVVEEMRPRLSRPSRS